MDNTSDVGALEVTVVGGSTALLELGGVRLITDPTFDLPGPQEDGRPARTQGPGLQPGDLGRVDVALVSHDQHPDNLDDAGRALLAGVAQVLTTTAGAARLGGTARGLEPYEDVEVDRPDGGRLRVRALPALHGPVGAEAETGPVIGFLLSGDGLPTTYVSGDNASLDVVRAIAQRVGTVDVALLFCGAASVPFLCGGQPLTLTAADAVRAADTLGARAVVPLHCDGWSHYVEHRADVEAAFAAAGRSVLLRSTAPGASISVA